MRIRRIQDHPSFRTPGSPIRGVYEIRQMRSIDWDGYNPDDLGSVNELFQGQTYPESERHMLWSESFDLTKLRITNPRDLSERSKRLLCPTISDLYEHRAGRFKTTEPSQLEGLPWGI